VKLAPAKYVPKRVVNAEVINSVVTVIGFLFALSFGFSLQISAERFYRIQNAVYAEGSSLSNMLDLFRNLDAKDPSTKNILYQALGTYTSQMRDEIMDDIEVGGSNGYDLYGIFKKIGAISLDGEGDEIDRIILAKILDELRDVSRYRLERVSALRSKIPLNLWIALQIFGLLTFSLVLLLDSGSKLLNVWLCEITAFSVCLFNWVLADYNSPFQGFIRVDLLHLDELIGLTHRLLQDGLVPNTPPAPPIQLNGSEYALLVVPHK
jgi:hypothetical protein